MWDFPGAEKPWGAGETRCSWQSKFVSARTRLLLDVSDEMGVCQKKGWIDDEPRATPALPRGRADGGAGALWVSDACPCALRTIAREGLSRFIDAR